MITIFTLTGTMEESVRTSWAEREKIRSAEWQRIEVCFRIYSKVSNMAISLYIIFTPSQDDQQVRRDRDQYQLQRRAEEEALLNLEFQMNQRVGTMQRMP